MVRIEIVWQPPLENNLDVLAYRLLEAVQQKNAKRVFIDGLSGFQSASIYPERIGRFLAALTNELRALDITTVISLELRSIFGPTIKVPFNGVSDIVENIILMRYVELRAQLYRLISVLKMRESDYDMAIHEFKITTQGLDVATTFESAEAILTGMAHSLQTYNPSSTDYTPTPPGV